MGKAEVKEIKEEIVNAVVDGCNCLNIRREPEVKSNNQIAILGRGTKIIVVNPKKTEKNKDGEWYKVRVIDEDSKEPADSGYAMKAYIKIV